MGDQPLDRDRITKLVFTIFADDLHAKRVASLAGAAVGVLEGAALGIHAIGTALAMAEGLKPKHAVKQVDRLLSNAGVPVWDLFASWVPFVVAGRTEIVTALDWTEFDADDQSTIVLSMITGHGRATPLLWKTVVKSELKGWRNEHEDVLLERFREALPAGVKVLDDDLERLSPLVHAHINMLGRYHFAVPEAVLRGELRPLRDPNDPDEILNAGAASE